MHDTLIELASKIELHSIRLEMIKAVHNALCDNIEDLDRTAKASENIMAPDCIEQAMNLAYAVSELLTQQMDIAKRIANESYAAAQSARAA